MNEIIERVVQAIKECDPSAGAPYEDTARAVIKAMRTPSAAMIDAMRSVDFKGDNDPDELAEWQAAIDAALD